MSKKRSKPKETGRNVIIKPIAYYKMLVHVLRFGNKARDPSQFKEVMGMLIGHLDGEGEIKNVIVEDAVPVSHGGSIEVDFAHHDYITFAAIDEEFAERNWFTIGWYHSHPGLRIFFSSTDVNNQLGWQTPNPSAIGIVFDHKYLENEGDLGFRTFRLDDLSKGPRTDYHEVETKVEPPDSNEFYFKIMELVNCIHSKEPPILEINETPELFGGISFPDKTDMLAVKPELKIMEIISAFQQGISGFLQLSLEPLIEFLNSWSQDLIKNIMENNLHMRTDLVELKDILTKSLENIQNSFKFSLIEKLNEIDTYFDDKFDGFDKGLEIIENSIKEIKDGLKAQLDNLFEKNVDLLQNKIMEVFDENINKLTGINNKANNIIENLTQQQDSLSSLSEKISSVKNLTEDKIKGSNESLKKALTDKINKIADKISNFHNEANTLLSKIDTITSKIKKS